MPYNGSGVYSAPSLPGSFNPAVTGQNATPADWTTLLADFATAWSSVICKDGQTTITANLPMATYRHTGVGNAVARTDYASAGQVQDGSMEYALTTGTDTILATLAPAITAYAVGQTFNLKKSASANTTAVTLNINSIGAGDVKWPNGSALAAGAIPANSIFSVSVADISTPTAPIYHLQTSPGASTALQVATQTFTSSGTYTPTSGMAYCVIELVGGGGGGGGVAATTSNSGAGGGGGAGSYAWLMATAATIGASKAVTIGAGGAGGSAGANAGSAGGDTSVGVLCIGKGGSGGGFSNVAGSVFGGAGGAGGVAGTGTNPLPGNYGFPGMGAINATSSPPHGGGGGGSFFGGGAQGPAVTSGGTATAGNAATANTGGGGSGAAGYNAAGTAAGGAGGSGYVRITEYCNV